MSGTAVIMAGKERWQIAFQGEASLWELLSQTGAPFSAPCGGNHICGKCKVFCTGALSPMGAEEKALLTRGESAAGVRLACFAKALGDVCVYPLWAGVETLSSAVLPPHGLTERGWGLAVDIGTTTIAMQLYRLEDGSLQGECLQPNRQSRFGADVIARIDFANQNEPELLEDTLHGQLEEMAASCMEQAGIQRLDRAVLTGNTTMLHFWERLPTRGIAIAPFTPSSFFGCESRYALRGAPVYLPPCLGAYIGADTVCAVLASGLMNRPEQISLLADLGTNGEVALCRGGRLLCASTAMGPAFEGAGLSFGMQAGPGAVSAVWQTDEGGVAVQVATDCVPAGVCGSGVLDAVRVMLERGVLDESGLLCENEAGVALREGQLAWELPGTGVWVTQKDIRQIQLAKSALCAGIETLLDAAGIPPEAVDRFYVAGGFGYYMNLSSAVRVGLFPEALAEHAAVIGNGALAGAAVLLLDRSFWSALDVIRSRGQELPLSGNPVFSERYVENMLFGEFEYD